MYIKKSTAILVCIIIVILVIILTIDIASATLFVEEANDVNKNTTSIQTETDATTKTDAMYDESGNIIYNAKYVKNLPDNALHPMNISGFQRYNGPSGLEDYSNYPVENLLYIARNKGYSEEEYPYWIRDDGCKMLGDYIICAADYNIHPYGSIINTSLGKAIVLETGGGLIQNNPSYCCDVDIYTDWK